MEKHSRKVAGDVVRIRIGDIVPADIEIVEGEFDESALTGESLPVEKRTVILPILTRYVGGERALGIVKATAIIFIVVLVSISRHEIFWRY